MENSMAALAFERSIRDAEKLLRFFDAVPQQEQAEAEVLKRAGLVMALASWETYVKAKVMEEFEVFARSANGSPLGDFVRRRLEIDLKRFFNPNTDRTRTLVKDYFGFDVTSEWVWNNYSAAQAKSILDALVKKRGNAAHEAKIDSHPSAGPDMVRREELAKAIRFLRGLVAATDRVSFAK